MPDPVPPVPAPGRVLVAGDWHGNTRWAQGVIRQAPHLLAGEDRKIILQLGDFGIWPGIPGGAYLADVAAALKESDTWLLFVDGNHEDFDQLHATRDQWVRDSGRPLLSPVPLAGGRIQWLPRGYRWTWHERTWLALGGGVSLDKAGRIEYYDWWPQEEITGEQERDVIAAGAADVMVTHECPGGVTHTFPPPPPWWNLADLARSDAHRERMQRVVDAVRPSHLIHGHLHIGYQRTCDFGFGPVRVTGLDMDGQDWNYAILDTRTMEWEKPQEVPQRYADW
jgi:Calcineurin-like phosphoesterase